MVSISSPSPLMVSMFSFSKDTLIPSPFSSRAVSSSVTVFRAKREVDLHRMRSIFPSGSPAACAETPGALPSFHSDFHPHTRPHTPTGISLNQLAVIADLRRQRVQHGVLTAGHAGVGSNALALCTGAMGAMRLTIVLLSVIIIRPFQGKIVSIPLFVWHITSEGTDYQAVSGAFITNYVRIPGPYG